MNEAFFNSDSKNIIENDNYFFYNNSEISNLEIIGQVLFNNYND
jgi:hypothetical protein